MIKMNPKRKDGRDGYHPGKKREGRYQSVRITRDMAKSTHLANSERAVDWWDMERFERTLGEEKKFAQGRGKKEPNAALRPLMHKVESLQGSSSAEFEREL